MSKSALSILGAVVCALAFWESARVGYARTYALQALKTNDPAKAERSTQLLPNDAEAHATRGVVLQRGANYADACHELERAVQLRPRDYFLWMMLGVTRDLNDDPQGGLAALRESVRLAPLYARPRWLIGNLLLRSGVVDEAFQQLRFAEDRNAGLLPNVIDLAWGTSRNDPVKTSTLIEPQTDEAHMALAIFFAAHKEGAAALEQFRATKSPLTADSDRLTQRLIEAGVFPESYEVWTKAHCTSCRPATFINGSFEEPIELNNQGFGWQLPANINGITLSVDTAEHENGAKSLRMDFNGNTDARAALLSQLLLVKPNSRYQITLHVKTKSFASTASPAVSVFGMNDDKTDKLAQSVIRIDRSDWQGYILYFSTAPNTRAARLIVNREDCPSNSCAAFGTVWLDSFSLNESP